jgi:hypothetical protein
MPRERKTHCKRGHERPPENLYPGWQCKRCIINASIARQKSMTPAQRADRERKHAYRITPERFLELLTEQENHRAICTIEFTDDRKPRVDHVHDESPRVRGLLCQQCNTVLGFAKDSIATLLSAVEYLKRFN